jgi:hypothetical protein
VRKVFYVFVAIFGISLFLLVAYAFSQSNLFTSNASGFTGLAPLANALEKISGVDTLVTVVFGMGTIITGIIRKVYE